jgi:hypothetical protein
LADNGREVVCGRRKDGGDFIRSHRVGANEGKRIQALVAYLSLLVLDRCEEEHEW